MLIQKDKHTLPKKDFRAGRNGRKGCSQVKQYSFPHCPQGTGMDIYERGRAAWAATCLYHPRGYRMHRCICINCYSPLPQDLKCSEASSLAKQSPGETLSGQQLPQSPLHKGSTKEPKAPRHPLQAVACKIMQLSVLLKLVYKEHIFVY